MSECAFIMANMGTFFEVIITVFLVRKSVHWFNWNQMKLQEVTMDVFGSFSGLWTSQDSCCLCEQKVNKNLRILEWHEGE